MSTSRLSPHLAFGDISPRQVWHATEAARLAGMAAGDHRDIDVFYSELGWREFSHHLLFHYRISPRRIIRRNFDAFPWQQDEPALRAWQRGRTGYPIVDAGMRELWQTGFMHNRVRMIVASFLIKHLMVDWRHGEAWFWDTLCDADPANNPASWQWVAGSGADAAPYFRIFNPVTQGEKFDPEGEYIRRLCRRLPACPQNSCTNPGKPRIQFGAPRVYSWERRIRHRSFSMSTPARAPLPPSSRSPGKPRKGRALRIAIIGSGIAGHGAAYKLTRHFGPAAVTVFEKEPRPGGHSATVDITYDGRAIAVDTGFIVYNELNYPLMTALFEELGASKPSCPIWASRSRSITARSNGLGQDNRVLASLLAQPSNVFRPAFWRMLADMMRFNKQAIRDFEAGVLGDMSLGAYLEAGRFNGWFRDNYILPMGAAIWSMPSTAVLDFPARSFLAFFNNHRLLHMQRPRWRTVTGGSRSYVRRLIERSGHQAVYGDAVLEVQRDSQGVRVLRESGAIETFDAVVMATHSDTTAELIAAHWPQEAAIVAQLRYAEADVYLHP